MRATLPASVLRSALERATKVLAPSQRPVPVALTGIRIAWRDGAAELTGSDGELTLTSRISCAGAPGEVLLVPGALVGWVCALAGAAEVHMVLADNGDLACDAGTGPYRFRTLSATYPETPEPGDERRAVDFSVLSGVLAGLRRAAGRDRVVRFVSGADSLSLSAADPYRLCHVHITGAGFGPGEGVVSLGVIERACRLGVNAASLDPKGRVLHLFGPDSRMAARLVDVTFPNVDDVVASTPACRAGLRRAELVAAVARLAPVAGDVPARVELDGATLTLSGSHHERGAGSESVSLTGPATESLRAAVSLAYLSDALDAHGDDEITLAWTGPLAPMHLSSGTVLRITTVIMPVLA